MTPRPEWLRSKEAMRDYIAALPRQAEWISLGPHYAPRFLKNQYRNAACDVYAVPIPGRMEPTEQHIAYVNRFYWATQGEGGCVTMWTAEPVGQDYPALMQLFTQEFRDIHDGLLAPDGVTPLADAWLRHPCKRLYERIVIVPRETVV